MQLCRSVVVLAAENMLQGEGFVLLTEIHAQLNQRGCAVQMIKQEYQSQNVRSDYLQHNLHCAYRDSKCSADSH
jgi:hypothetical protein